MSSKIRLRVVAKDILVRCPHGQGYGHDGLTTLKDCYLDSATPGTRCSVMMLGGRCEQVAEFTKRTGWRAHVRTTEPETAHALPPVRLIYAPLDTAGTKWMAVNVMTGERKQIDMHEVEPYSAKHGAYSAYLSSRRLGRLCTDGSQLSEPYEGWQGGGDEYLRREWCDCAVCVALRPRMSTKPDPQDVYRESLPADLRNYWDAFQLRTEQWRKQMGMTSDTPPRTQTGGIDFVNGFGQGHARSPYSVKSSQEPSLARKTTINVSPVEDDVDETTGSERAMLNKAFRKLTKPKNKKPR